MIEKLESVGLTQTEARIYLFLLERKEAKAGQLCAALGLRTSHIYGILEQLLGKGVVSYKMVNNVKIFYPADPSNLLAMFKEKEERLAQEKEDLAGFVEQLKRIEIARPRQMDFKYFEGTQGVRSMFMEFIASWEAGSTVRVCSAPLAYERWNAFLLEFFHKPRGRRRVALRIMLPKSLRRHGEERTRFPLTEVKYTDAEFPSEFGVAGDYVYLLSEGEKPYAILIRDANFAQTQLKVFEQLWGLKGL